MKTVITVVFVSVSWLLLTGSPSLSSRQNDQKEAKDIIKQITSPDWKIRHDAYNAALEDRWATIKNLLAVVDSPVENEERFYFWDTPRNIAIALLGDMQAADAVDRLLEWIVPHNGQDPGEIIISNHQVNEPYAVTALVKIGKPASLESLKRLALEDNDKVVTLGLSKRGILLRIIRKVEGDDVARFMLQNAIEKEQDKDKKANLTAALELLDKWIKADAERAKQREEQSTTPPPTDDTAPPVEGGTNPLASGGRTP